MNPSLKKRILKDASMYDKELVHDILEQIIEAIVVHICQLSK